MNGELQELTQAMVLAIVQGLTEFLPVSSSAHLILPAQLLGWQDQGLVFDVAVHVGSLLAVVYYFRLELMQLCRGSLDGVLNRRWNADASMLLNLVVATMPLVIAGVLLQDYVAAELRSIAVIAISTIVFGLLLGWADTRWRGSSALDLRAALVIGLAQVLAIVPGTSRSGITMTAALMCGLDRQTAARFSFLLSVPVIAGAGALQLLNLASSNATVAWGLLLTASAVSAVTAYLCIAWFLRLLDRVGFMPFVIYRCLLGLVLLWIWW